VFVFEVLRLVIQTFKFFHNFVAFTFSLLMTFGIIVMTISTLLSIYWSLFLGGSYKFVRCCSMFGLFPTLAKVLSFFSLVVLGMFLSIAFYLGIIKWKQNIFLDKHMSCSF